MNQTSSGITTATHNGRSTLSDSFSYPLNIFTAYQNLSSPVYSGSLDHGFDRAWLPPSSAVSSSIKTRQLATGNLTINATSGRVIGGIAETSEVFDFADTESHTYHRDVAVANRTVLHDHVSGTLAT